MDKFCHSCAAPLGMPDFKGRLRITASIVLTILASSSLRRPFSRESPSGSRAGSLTWMRRRRWSGPVFT